LLLQTSPEVRQYPKSLITDDELKDQIHPLKKEIRLL
jgi:hypothetical protein